MTTSTLQTRIAAQTLSRFGAFPTALERRLETERERLSLWLPVAFGAGSAGEERAAGCAAADVVISERWLPRECVARWLTIDRDTLEQSGGLALYPGTKPRLVSALRAGDTHPWRRPHELSGNDEAVPTADLAP